MVMATHAPFCACAAAALLHWEQFSTWLRTSLTRAKGQDCYVEHHQLPLIDQAALGTLQIPRVLSGYSKGLRECRPSQCDGVFCGARDASWQEHSMIL